MVNFRWRTSPTERLGIVQRTHVAATNRERTIIVTSYWRARVSKINLPISIVKSRWRVIVVRDNVRIFDNTKQYWRVVPYEPCDFHKLSYLQTNKYSFIKFRWQRVAWNAIGRSDWKSVRISNKRVKHLIILLCVSRNIAVVNNSRLILRHKPSGNLGEGEKKHVANNFYQRGTSIIDLRFIVSAVSFPSTVIFRIHAGTPLSSVSFKAQKLILTTLVFTFLVLFHLKQTHCIP